MGAFSPRGNIQLRTLHSTYSKRATTSTMRQLSLLLFLSVAMLCSSSTLRVKRDAPDCYFHGDCGTTKACSKSQCTDLCFSEDCNQEVNNARDEWSNTPLHLAAFNDSVVAMRLIETSANVDSTNKWGETPLHWAAKGNLVDVASLLLANSADVNSADNNGETALHLAAGLNHVDVAKVLIENSANVDSTTNWGSTALHSAARSNSVDVAMLLIENSANLDATVVSGLFRGLTPLQVAEKWSRQEMVDLLKNA